LLRERNQDTSMVQAAIRRPVSPDTQLLSQAILSRSNVGQNAIGIGFFSEYLIFSLQISFHEFSVYILSSNTKSKQTWHLAMS
jgi:hypothetical protein